MQIRRPDDLGALIRSARSERGLNQQELADRLGTSRWWVIEMERGKSTARLDLVLRALNELGVTLTASMSEAGTSPPSEPPDLIDIDAIADTGLSAGRGSQPGSRRGR
jgi:HTH-type transcriptional regulator / antitoxin HipB